MEQLFGGSGGGFAALMTTPGPAHPSQSQTVTGQAPSDNDLDSWLTTDFTFEPSGDSPPNGLSDNSSYSMTANWELMHNASERLNRIAAAQAFADVLLSPGEQQQQRQQQHQPNDSPVSTTLGTPAQLPALNMFPSPSMSPAENPMLNSPAFPPHMGSLFDLRTLLPLAAAVVTASNSGGAMPTLASIQAQLAAATAAAGHPTMPPPTSATPAVPRAPSEPAYAKLAPATNAATTAAAKAAAAAEKAAEEAAQRNMTPEELDKRRRNTAASARFRAKKKQREQALERSAKEMTGRLDSLEKKVKEYEMEIKWLRQLVSEKTGAKRLRDIYEENGMNLDAESIAAAPSKEIDIADLQRMVASFYPVQQQQQQPQQAAAPAALRPLLPLESSAKRPRIS